MTYKPTDAELDALRQADNGELNFVTLRQFRIIARAALAKWGTPAGAGGKVYLVATGLTNEAGTVELYERHDKFVPLADCEVLYTTPQPTQAQAGAVPLTPEQIKDEASHHGFIGSTEMLVKFVRGIEAAHGFKEGGQHVAN